MFLDDGGQGLNWGHPIIGSLLEFTRQNIFFHFSTNRQISNLCVSPVHREAVRTNTAKCNFQARQCMDIHFRSPEYHPVEPHFQQESTYSAAAFSGSLAAISSLTCFPVSTISKAETPGNPHFSMASTNSFLAPSSSVDPNDQRRKWWRGRGEKEVHVVKASIVVARLAKGISRPNRTLILLVLVATCVCCFLVKEDPGFSDPSVICDRARFNAVWPSYVGCDFSKHGVSLALVKLTIGRQPSPQFDPKHPIVKHRPTQEQPCTGYCLDLSHAVSNPSSLVYFFATPLFGDVSRPSVPRLTNCAVVRKAIESIGGSLYGVSFR